MRVPRYGGVIGHAPGSRRPPRGGNNSRTGVNLIRLAEGVRSSFPDSPAIARKKERICLLGDACLDKCDLLLQISGVGMLKLGPLHNERYPLPSPGTLKP